MTMDMLWVRAGDKRFHMSIVVLTEAGAFGDFYLDALPGTIVFL